MDRLDEYVSEVCEKLNGANKYREDYIRNKLIVLFQENEDIPPEKITKMLVRILNYDKYEDEPSVIYKKHNITYIQKEVENKCQYPGLKLTKEIIINYIDNIMKLDSLDELDPTIPDKSDDAIVDVFVLDMDGWQDNTGHDLVMYQKLIDTQSPELLKKLFTETHSTWGLAYYIGPQTKDILDMIPKTTFTNKYKFVRRQTLELNQALFDRALLKGYGFTYDFNHIIGQIRNPTDQMCKNAVSHEPYNIFKIPINKRSEELYCIAAGYIPFFMFKNAITPDKLTESICQSIASNTNSGCNKPDFSKKLEYIPIKFRTIDVYYSLMVGEGEDLSKSDHFVKCLENVPTAMRQRITDHLIKHRKVEQKIKDMWTQACLNPTNKD